MAWLLALTGVAVPWSVVLPGGVLAIGIAVLVGGERVTRHGLGGLGIALAAIALLLPAAPSGISPVAGERTVVVTDDTALQAGYGLGMGTMVLDLRAIDLEEAVTAVAATVGLGELTVLVPEGAAVRGTAQVGAGEAVAFGATSAGIGPRRSFDTASDGDEGPVLELTLRVGLGQIEVDR
ncbi:MAG: hypothetical protein JJT89_00725 [Nitriliruptoraceae bacterium]|nr:hypothetical protein [Nitriliruptoraceae bacterium]